MKAYKFIIVVIVFFVFSNIALTQYYMKVKSDSVALETDSVSLTTDIYRGLIDWQASTDKKKWTSLNKYVDTLNIRIDSSAYYRAIITEGTCNKVISDTVHLFERVTLTSGNQFTVDSVGGIFILLNGIKVKIPRGAVLKPKVIRIEKLNIDEVNILSATKIPENNSFLSGISITTDEFDFIKPIKVKIPIQDLKGTGLAVLRKLNTKYYKWFFSDETLIVNPKDDFIEIVFNALDQQNTILKSESDINRVESFFIERFGDIFNSDDACREIGYNVISKSNDNSIGDGCGAMLIYEDIVYNYCKPPQTGLYVGLEFSSDCIPILTTIPSKGKVEKDKTISIMLNTTIAGFPLSEQEIQISTTGNLYCPSSIVFTGAGGSRSISVKGLEVGKGTVTAAVSFDYHLTTIHASGNTGTENYESEPPIKMKKNYTIDVEVYYIPIVSTNTPKDIKFKKAVVGGNVISDEGEEVTEYGIYFGSSKFPLGSGIGKFETTLSDLIPDTEYEVAAYATNIAGTAYGGNVSFKTLNPVITEMPEVMCESAVFDGEILYVEDETVLERGFYWGKSGSSKIKHFMGQGYGFFSDTIWNLESNTEYFVKAYAIYDFGIIYGEQIKFKTLGPIGTVTDIDGNIYSIVEIGTQVWMTENLKTTRYNDGSPIPLVTDDLEWYNLGQEAYCWFLNNQATYKDQGALYKWFTVTTGKLCPVGWHVPDNSDWLTLIEFLGGFEVAGGKLKEVGTTHWKSPNIDATNYFCFSAQATGGRGYDGGVWYENEKTGGWWSRSTADTGDENKDLHLGYSGYVTNKDSEFHVANSLKDVGKCVRCVRD